MAGKVPQAEPAKVKDRAAIMAPALLNMEYENLLNLYKSRAGDIVEKTLIEDIANIRINSDKDTGEKLAFKEKFAAEQAKINGNIPGLKEDQAKAEYLNNVETVCRH